MSAVVDAVRAQKEAIDARDAAILRQLARDWLQVEKALEGRIESLVDQITAMQARGKTPSLGKLYQLGRLKNLLIQAQEQTALYAGRAAEYIAREQATSVALGVQDAASVLGMSIGGQFDRLSATAIEAMIAATAGTGADGAPLRQLLFERMVRGVDGSILPGVQERLIQTLRNAIVQGWNPKKTAKLLKDDLAGGLNKALVIARTETMRAYRLGSSQQYTQSGMVEGVVRMCAHTPSTCLACLADEGTVYPSEEAIPDHPNGRCTGVPWVKGTDKPAFEAGEKWLRNQDEATQRGIMGSTRYDKWQAGEVTFADFATRTEHAVWGGGIAMTPIRSL